MLLDDSIFFFFANDNSLCHVIRVASNLLDVFCSNAGWSYVLTLVNTLIDLIVIVMLDSVAAIKIVFTMRIEQFICLSLHEVIDFRNKTF